VKYQLYTRAIAPRAPTNRMGYA